MYFLLKPNSPPLLCWTRAPKSTFWKRTQGFYTWIQSMLPSLANIKPSHSRSDTSPGVSNDLERQDNILQRSPSYCHPLVSRMQWNAAADETRRWDSEYLGSGPQGCHLHERGLWERHVPCLWNIFIVKSGVQAGWSLRIIPAFEFYLHSFLSLFP